jgi:nickel/cobalt exporter
MGEAPPAPVEAHHSHMLEPALAGDHGHRHAHAQGHIDHDHAPGLHDGHGHAHDDLGWHSHGWGTYHSHRIDLITDNRPKLGVLLVLGIAGGLMPDPAALALLLGALSSGQVMLGLVTVLVFSLGFAATLVVVGVVAAQVGQKILKWLSSIWAVRLQIATTLLILGIGVVLTVGAATRLAALPG